MEECQKDYALSFLMMVMTYIVCSVVHYFLKAAVDRITCRGRGREASENDYHGHFTQGNYPNITLVFENKCEIRSLNAL